MKGIVLPSSISCIVASSFDSQVMISSLTGERGFIEIFVLNIFEIHSICTSTGIDFQARVLVFISTSA